MDDILVTLMIEPPKASPHASRLRTGRSSELGRVYSVTKCTFNRRPLLLQVHPSGNRVASEIVRSMRHLHQSGIWACLGFVIMPDHVHLVVKLLEGDLSKAMKSFAQFTSRRINALLGFSGPFWQEGFHDHAVRDRESLDSHLRYIVENPVRAGLTTKSEDWAHQGIYPDW